MFCNTIYLYSATIDTLGVESNGIEGSSPIEEVFFTVREGEINETRVVSCLDNLEFSCWPSKVPKFKVIRNMINGIASKEVAELW